jgi:hypothetical protein
MGVERLVCSCCARRLPQTVKPMACVHRRSGEHRVLAFCAECSERRGSVWRLTWRPVEVER